MCGLIKMNLKSKQLPNETEDNFRHSHGYLYLLHQHLTDTFGMCHKTFMQTEVIIIRSIIILHQLCYVELNF